jgi:hypothetical protein
MSEPHRVLALNAFVLRPQVEEEGICIQRGVRLASAETGLWTSLRGFSNSSFCVSIAALAVHSISIVAASGIN